MKTFVFIMALLTTSIFSKVHGQGAALITPMSDVSLEPARILDFAIFNRLQKELVLTVKHYCEIDNKEYEGIACDQYFRVNYSDGYLNERLTLGAQKNISVKVQLKNFAVKYALFKPKFEPLEEKQPKKGIRFVFGYQPGFLYLVKADNKTKLKKPVAAILDNGENKLIHFKFDVTKLPMPQILNISARVTNKKTGKTVKLVKMATNKIVDPSRKTLDIQGIYGDAGFKDDVCYQLYIKPVSKNGKLYKIKGCEYVASIDDVQPGEAKQKKKKKKKRRKKRKKKSKSE